MSTSPQYNVTVTVNSDGTPSCTPDTLEVKDGPGNIVFTLQNPGDFIFAPNHPIVFGPNQQFTTTSVAADSVTVSDANTNRVKKSYSYTVKLKNTVTGRITSSDPNVENDPAPKAKPSRKAVAHA